MSSFTRTLTRLAAAAVLLWQCAALSAAGEPRVTILFTHDLHARLDSFALPGGGEGGGFARLAALAAEERKADPGGTLLLDAGDFCSGTLFDAILPDEAPELNAMARMGYDAVTFGNHDFEAGPANVTAGLAAVRAGPRPEIVLSNTNLSEEKPGSAELARALAAWPVKKYAVFSRNGLKIGVFGLMGREAAFYVQTPGLSFTDRIAAASETVKALREKEGCDMVVALSHSGTSSAPDRSEDSLLAAAVPGIDVIISGHTHTLLKKPLAVGNTLIVSSGYWGRRLGRLTLEKKPGGGFRAAAYRLIETGPGPEDKALTGMVEGWKRRTEELYLGKYGLKFDSVVAFSPFPFVPPTNVENSTEPLAAGDLAADAFRAEVKAAEGLDHKYISAAFIPLGFLKSELPEGIIRTPDVFRVLPIGAGPDGKAGYPLTAFYLTGADISRLLEAEATLARVNADARLETSGVRFSWSLGAPPFARIKDVSLEEPDGTYKPLAKEKLYRVVMSAHAALYLSISFKPALIPLGPAGAPLNDIKEAVIYTSPGGKAELKEWVALARYLASFPRTGPGGLPQVPERYRAPRNSETVLP
ncbi:MAG: bifunctional UDP-sugar hydrolase/5'-nucleotidase [Elusimicrobiota bacterium]|nr:bifunctional UDP-sugar hydrolase/5'-nucleotidase [Elusimicrobiota bacterium]